MGGGQSKQDVKAKSAAGAKNLKNYMTSDVKEAAAE